MAAYDTFAAAAETHALKVVLEATPVSEKRAEKEVRLSVAARSNPSAAAVDVILRDGSTLRLRAPAQGDAGALVAFFERPLRAEPLPALPRSPHDRRRARRALPRAELARPRRPRRHAGRRPAAAKRSSRSASTQRLRDPAAAEVAFAVADELQGRGIGTRLLERLAALAAEQGIERFVAEVLPDNRAMLGVFEGRRLRGRRASWTAARSRSASRSRRPSTTARASTSATTSPSRRPSGRSSSPSPSP